MMIPVATNVLATGAKPCWNPHTTSGCKNKVVEPARKVAKDAEIADKGDVDIFVGAAIVQMLNPLAVKTFQEKPFFSI